LFAVTTRKNNVRVKQIVHGYVFRFMFYLVPFDSQRPTNLARGCLFKSDQEHFRHSEFLP
jgi:hypothetical protein